MNPEEVVCDRCGWTVFKDGRHTCVEQPKIQRMALPPTIASVLNATFGRVAQHYESEGETTEPLITIEQIKQCNRTLESIIDEKLSDEARRA